ncbi:hypothetical protein BVRB_2g033060 [Beta vulgaris subsp. vulgaris]|uniref:Neprosin PEP catalytic domain-containing protein n=1 Tax=Beta vulgaris subsp. vulgaris TaxID=3555 RepID=A0A0J8D1C7_BETVV|nr:hypothetical protein BVRB_2g033060 [Beta vulgaris subsp. vulgaris]
MAFQRWRFLAEILLLFSYVFISAYVAQGRNSEKNHVTNINSKLKFRRRPALKSIRSSDGDIIDCVDIYKQPAFDDPLLMNHTIQMRPNYIPDQDTMDIKNKSSSRTTLQIWRKNGSCPQGTIPIRRVRKKDLLRFKNLETFSSKKQTHSNRSLVIYNTTTAVLGYQPNRSASILIATVTHYVGAKAGGATDYESVKSGWMVNPKLYGDTQTRFFAHWTTDGNQKTGCYDLLCSGFVQTSHEVALGAAISPLSSEGGTQYEIGIQLTMDPKTGNWWLLYNDKFDLGYWPRSLMGDYLRSGATMVQWGGEVYSPNVARTPHTTTGMGSGSWPQGLFGYASYISHIRSVDYSYSWRYPNFVAILSDEPDCYAAYHYVPGFMEEPTLFFGGPGGFRNPRCP